MWLPCVKPCALASAAPAQARHSVRPAESVAAQAGEVVARKLAAPKLKVNRRGGALFPTSYGVDSDKKNPNPKP